MILTVRLKSIGLFCCLALLLVPGTSVGGADAPVGVSATIVTADGEQISAALSGIDDGKLVVAGEAPRSIPLADIERIELGKSAAPPAGADLVWIGQDNHDLVQVGGASGGNSIQDLHLSATNLKPVGLTQITVTCRFPSKRLHVWRLDTSKTPHWRLAIATKPPQADLYLEPSSEDSFEQTFEATFTYSDGSTSKLSTRATTHTSDQAKLDTPSKPSEGAKTAEATANSNAVVHVGPPTAAGVRIAGKISQISGETLSLETDWKGKLEIPLLRVQGIWLGKAAPRADFDKQLQAPAGEDVVFLVAADKTTAQVSGSVLGLADGKLSIRYQGADRTIKEERLLGLVFAAHPQQPAAAALYQVVTFTSGDSLPGRLTAIGPSELELEMPWNQTVKIPTSAVADIRIRNGKLTFLGDLEPIAVEETPYFGRMMHWRRDEGFDGNPPRVKGQQPARALAMHSRSVLTYALDGQYEKFKSRLGFDDSGSERGRVACRVLVDGRELFGEKDLRGDGESRDVEVSVHGARQLALEVDFGADEDVGDRIIWAEPRLFRSEVK